MDLSFSLKAVFHHHHPTHFGRDHKLVFFSWKSPGGFPALHLPGQGVPPAHTCALLEYSTLY